jgi:hypothetical protein
MKLNHLNNTILALLMQSASFVILNFKIEAVKKQFTMCCNKGSINVTPFKHIPEELKDLFTGKILTSA